MWSKNNDGHGPADPDSHNSTTELLWIPLYIIPVLGTTVYVCYTSFRFKEPQYMSVAGEFSGQLLKCPDLCWTNRCLNRDQPILSSLHTFRRVPNRPNADVS